MNSIKKILKILGFIFLVFLICIFTPFKNFLGENTAYLTIENKSNSTIKSLSVSLSKYEDNYKIEGLNHNGKFTILFKNFGESHYILIGELTSGIKINEALGYISSGFNSEDTIIIHEDGKLEYNGSLK